MSMNLHYSVHAPIQLRTEFVQTPTVVTESIMQKETLEQQIFAYLLWVKQTCPVVYDEQKKLCDQLILLRNSGYIVELWEG